MHTETPNLIVTTGVKGGFGWESNFFVLLSGLGMFLPVFSRPFLSHLKSVRIEIKVNSPALNPQPFHPSGWRITE